MHKTEELYNNCSQWQDEEGYYVIPEDEAQQAIKDAWNAALDWAAENFDSDRIVDQQIEPIKESILKGKIK